MPIALVTGITGQDGSFLAELLLNKGYDVHGVVRRSSNFNTARIEHLCEDLHDPRPNDPHKKLHLHYGDITDSASMRRIVAEVRPDEVYHLAAQSHVRLSFDMPEYTVETIVNGTMILLDAVLRERHQARLYNACSSEIFGSSPPPQNEQTPFRPRSPYAAAKAFTHHMVNNYRDAYGLFAVNGILFNHTSVRQSPAFVTRKITRAVGRIRCGLQEKLYLGNLGAKRDFGWAPEYVEMMWRMLQAETPVDYVIGTGVTRSIAELVERAFRRAGLTWQDHVEIDARHYRAAEVDALEADASLASSMLGWTPSMTFEPIVDAIVDFDLRLAEREKSSAEVASRTFL